ncbi:hypothetical protein GDO81_024184 [Engystomops pustulosus]|uniref:BH3-interacting domain death agonist n=1 Tax=Engystomops pustulosus TaxID=76066 RepID=A0AAV6ZH78_ENGPU|nr:hypothetical protein GDO81_024184 [Engystomops pustulosus]
MMEVELIFVAFLKNQKSGDSDYRFELGSLEKLLGHGSELETDGRGGVGYRCIIEPDGGPQPDDDSELYRRIGAQLAEMGDRFEQDGTITSEVVEGLVNDILSKSLTEDRFADAVKSVLSSSLPPGMEVEQATMIAAMSLTSRVGKSVPSLLQNCFTTAAAYIRRNCSSSLEQITRQADR